MNNSETNAYLPIADYAVIGNLHTVALVSLQGSIDYLPFMRIDSPTIFLNVLDRHKGGQIFNRTSKGQHKVKTVLPATNEYTGNKVLHRNRRCGSNRLYARE